MSHCAHHSSIAQSTALLLEMDDASRDQSTRDSECILTEFNCKCIKLPQIHRLVLACLVTKLLLGGYNNTHTQIHTYRKRESVFSIHCKIKRTKHN